MQTSLADWINLALMFGGIIGFLFGLYQYTYAQRWKRLEFAATEIQRLTQDEDLRIAMMFLEYSKRPVPLPPKYFELLDEKIIDHSHEKLSKILKIDFFETDPEYFIYRDSLGRLFEYLEQMYHFINMGLIKAKDVKQLQDVLDRIANPRWIDKETLNTYVRQFDDIEKLMKLYGIAMEKI